MVKKILNCYERIKASGFLSDMHYQSKTEYSVPSCKPLTFKDVKNSIAKNNVKLTAAEVKAAGYDRAYNPIEIPKELLMALAAQESQLTWVNKQNEITAIEFDPCAHTQRSDSTALGLMQITRRNLCALQKIGFIKLPKECTFVQADLCNDPDESIRYASIIMQEKCNNIGINKLLADEANDVLRLAFAAGNYGPSKQKNYGPNAIEIMETLKKDYTESALLAILNVQKKRGYTAK